ncbi:Mercuric reductase [Enterobacter hormaechei]|uniref:FAD-dependent oxidoreductase n=2 Tax=Enterobacter asburiae TaxID=61645 RepID=A0AAW7ZV95_ENTAS|nr:MULTISPECIES: FAD-dependent oxidoreductase [Enterobacteriaceae]HCM9251454.1 FAD-dependent oxidoreductase [Enterobacter hormaechei subsp. hoffmannii]HCP9984585.1 FAD-dependent oxidoreductase [Escherichia coli]HCT8710964.1 FAD-dependent oxidoreductase [Raoultella ornithinolytica]AVL16927.1 mercuric reductase [Enterobacter cloacae]AZL63567.1 mercuric reductase [Enterobacter asburiae]
MKSTPRAPHEMFHKIYDLVTIGSGSAARAAANEARRLDKSVAMIEQGVAGGTCLNVGCIPSKTLLAAAAIRFSALQKKFSGIDTSAAPVDLALLVWDKDQMIGQFRETYHVQGPSEAGIDVFRGAAAFTLSQNQEYVSLNVHGIDGITQVHAKNVVIASGASPFIPEIPGLKDVDYLTSSTAMSLTKVPESLLVIGGNAIGLEQAQLFSRLGSKVKVIEVATRIAPFEDHEISAVLAKSLNNQGIEFLTGANITQVKAMGDLVSCTVKIGESTYILSAEKIMIATGRRPFTENLNLNAVNISTGPRGQVIVDENLKTSNSRVWAAGDVTGGAQFVYVAVEQGKLAASNALGDKLDSLDYNVLPRVTFTSPELASVGLTALQAEEEGIPYEVRELPVAFVLRAIVSRHTDGLVRLISNSETGKILGIHMVGESAGDVIGAATYVLSANMTVQQLAKLWSPEFTMTESLKNVAKTSPIR